MRKIVLAAVVAVVVAGCGTGKLKRVEGEQTLTAHYVCPANMAFTMNFSPDFTAGELVDKADTAHRYTLMREGEGKGHYYRDSNGITLKENLSKKEALIDLGPGKTLYCRIWL